jgi:D-alanine transaminase
MSRISYLNGAFLPHEKCLVHIEDRGFQFGDGIYEVTLFKNARLIDVDLHLARLFYSLEAVKISHDFSKNKLKEIQTELFARNAMQEGFCYLQITRGAANRVTNCPKTPAPTVVATVAAVKKISAEEFIKGFSVITGEDIRWKRCDIKTLNLLASTLMNQKAKDLGADDMIFIRDQFVTEATFANVFIVDNNDTLITRNADNLILQGITRNRLIKLALQNGLKVSERKFGIDELMSAREVFLSSSTLIMRPVVKIDGKIIGDGKAGKVTGILDAAYKNFMA